MNECTGLREMTTMSYLTVRNLPAELTRALQEEKRRRGTSLNQVVIDLLRQALGLGWGEPRRNGLEKLAGDWTQEDLKAFEEATAVFEAVDEGLWR
jgi:plasmid stability protein